MPVKHPPKSKSKRRAAPAPSRPRVQRPAPAPAPPAETEVGIEVEVPMPPGSLSQKERALFKLGLILGIGKEPEVRAYVLRAMESGWTRQDIDHARRLARWAFPCDTVETTTTWVEETLDR